MRTHHKTLYAASIIGAAALASPIAAAEVKTAAALPMLKLQRQADAATTLKALRDVVPEGKAADAKTERTKGRLRLAGATWRLDVFGDGSAAEFSDTDAFARAHASGVQAAQAMSREALQTMGQKFIDEKLSKLIVLGRGERLVLAATSQRTEGGVDTKGQNAYSAIVANRVIFTREIDGVPVVGAGSKVTVTFLNDGSLESFRYDWPNYRARAKAIKLATATEVLRRVQQVSGVRTNKDVNQELPPMSDLQAIKGPIKLGSKVELEDLTCGYYDPGFAVRSSSASIQPGCYYHVMETEGEGDYITRSGYSGAVPSATRFERDAAWPEVNVLRGVNSKASKGSDAGPATEVVPVPPRPASKGQ